MRVCVLVLCLLALSVRAHADDPSDLEEAGREFAAAQAADARHQYQLAIQHYLRANDLAPHPNAMFNIAADYERIGKLRESAVWYQRYLDHAGNAPDRGRIERLMHDLATRPARVTIKTTPTAKISLDGKYLHESPFTGKLPGGHHRLLFEYDGHREYRDLDIEFGEPVNLDLELRGETGTLRVEGLPYGAPVTVDGEAIGALPMTTEVGAGPHVVRVEMEHFTPFETSVTVLPNQITPVHANLTRALGSTDSSGVRVIRAGYLLGVGGGADLRGNGALGLFDLGVKILQFDFAIRLGKATGLSALDFVARWAIGERRVAPYVGGGYAISIASSDASSGTSSSNTSTGGYVLVGGVRIEIAKGERAALAGVVESGLRYFPGADNGLVVPVMASLQVVYK